MMGLTPRAASSRLAAASTIATPGGMAGRSERQAGEFKQVAPGQNGPRHSLPAPLCHRRVPCAFVILGHFALD